MENKKSTDVYAGSGVEKAAKWFHIMAIISIVLSVIGVIAGVVLIFMAYEGESVGIKLFSAFLLWISSVVSAPPGSITVLLFLITLSSIIYIYIYFD